MSKKRSRVELKGDGTSVDNSKESDGHDQADILDAKENKRKAEAPNHDLADEKDGGQSSDDEAPEEVSKVAAATQAGRRRKAEIEARPRAPKRNRGKASKQRKAGDDDETRELELPSELLAVVKSRGLERAEKEEASRKKSEVRKAATSKTSAKLVQRRTPKVENLKRSDNFRLVVLEGGRDVDGVASKPHAVDSAKKFLRQRRRNQKRVSGVLFKARRRLGPSPCF